MISKIGLTPSHTIKPIVEKLYKLILNFDPEIAYHSVRVKKIAFMLTDNIDISKQTRNDIANAALLHDIGFHLFPGF